MTLNDNITNNDGVAAVPVVATDPSKVNSFVEKYRLFGKQSVRSLLELCRLLVQAKEELAPLDFSEFCRRVSLQESGATFTKYKKIGEAYLRLIPHADNLPHAWTSLYDLATVAPAKFEEICPSLNPHITAAEIEALTAKRPSKPTQQPRSAVQTDPQPQSGFMISLADVPPEKLDDAIEVLQDMSHFYGFKVTDVATGKVLPPVLTIVEAA